MKLLAIASALGFSGAQLSALDFFELLKGKAEIKVITCSNADHRFIQSAKELGLEIYSVPCITRFGYPVMSHGSHIEKLVKWADIAWITDIEFSIAPVIIRCKQGINIESSRIGSLSKWKAYEYWMADFLKGPLDYYRWQRLIKDNVNFIDGFIAVSNALWNIHVAHIPNLKDIPHVIVRNPVITPLKYVSPKLDESYDNYILFPVSHTCNYNNIRDRICKP